MKKIILLLLAFVSILTFSSGCDAKSNSTNLEFKEFEKSATRLDFNKFYKIDSYVDLQDLSEIEEIELPYDEKYFESNGLIVFVFSEGSGGNRHKLKVKANSNEVYVDYKRTSTGMTCDMAFWLVTCETSLEKLDKINRLSDDYRTLKQYKETEEVKLVFIKPNFPNKIIEALENEEMQLTFDVKPRNAKYSKVLWTSSDPNIATVSNDGKVTFLKEGRCKIDVNVDEVIDSINVIVSNSPKEIDGEYYANMCYSDPTIIFPSKNTYFKFENDKLLTGLEYNKFDLYEKEFKASFFKNFNIQDKSLINKSIFAFPNKGFSASISKNGFETCEYNFLISKSNKIYAFQTNYNIKTEEYEFLAAYVLTKKEELISQMPKKLPDDFSFNIHFGFDGYYDSSTCKLENGYNYTYGVACVTKLELKESQLEEIYRTLRDIKFDTLPGDIYATPYIQEPSSTPYISITYNSAHYKVTIRNIMNARNWVCYKELGEAYYKIVQIITDTDEYKHLLPNEKLYY